MSGSGPRLSVGIPIYNGEEFIGEALESILGQRFGDFEVVVSDNGSTDRTEAIIREFMASDSRISFSRNEKNLGATANYNAVFRRASGQYFKWASSNDICRQGFFEECVEILDKHYDVVLACPNTRLFDSDTRSEEDCRDDMHLIQDDPVERFIPVVRRLGLNNVMNGVARSDAMRRSNLIPDIIAGDKNFIAELALMGKIYQVPEFLFYRRMDAKSATRAKSDDEVHRHFDPSGSKPMRFQNWKALALYWRAVRQSRVSLTAKLRLYSFLSTWARHNRNHLGRDLREAFLR